MEHNNGSSTIDEEDSPDNDKIVAYRSSSSSSSSYSNHFEVDIGEDDAAFYEFEENDSASVVLTPTLPQTCDLDTVYGSIKQSPPIQVMDQQQSPSSMIGPKHRSSSNWSLGSSESLFSIRTGNNSFSLDGGFYLSKSGELKLMDDGSCFTPDGTKSCMSPSLPTVMDTSAENEQKEETIETKNVSVIDSEREKGNLSASNSTDSFAFPVLAGGSPSPTKVGAEKPEPAATTPPAEAAQGTPKAAPANPKTGGNQWFHCFSCFPMCC